MAGASRLAQCRCHREYLLFQAGVCKRCAKGEYFDAANLLCLPCPGGSYKESSGQMTSCKLCPAHTYNNQTGSTGEPACLECPANTGTSGQGACSARQCNCLAGFFQDNKNECRKCPKGEEYIAALNDCRACQPGSFKDGVGQDSPCAECSASTYNALAGSTDISSCLDCPTHTTTRGKHGADSVTQCECTEEYFRSNDKTKVECLQCAKGEEYDADSNMCVACVAGKFKDGVGQDSPCAECSASTYNALAGSTDISSCLDCPTHTTTRGKHGADSVTQCECTEEYFRSNDKTKVECLQCAKGEEYDADSNMCVACAKGKYKTSAGQGDKCMECPGNSYNAVNGATKLQACLACPLHSGTASGGGASQLQQCTCNEGFFRSSDTSAVQCLRCPKGEFYSEEGNECVTCPAGTFKAESGQAEKCNACPVGTFNEDTGGTQLSACVACATNSRTVGSGSTPKQDCRCVEG